MTDSVIDIKEPKTNREMFQFIMRDMADVKSGMEGFKASQKCQDEEITKIKSQMPVLSAVKWIGSLFIVGFVAFLVLIGTGQLQVIKP